MRFRKALRALGDRIRELRRAKNWNQEKLAEKCGLTDTTIGDIERADKCCTLESLFLIAAALQTTVAALTTDLDQLVPSQPTEYAQEDNEGDDQF